MEIFILFCGIGSSFRTDVFHSDPYHPVILSNIFSFFSHFRSPRTLRLDAAFTCCATAMGDAMTDKRVLEKEASASTKTPFEMETADEGNEAYFRGGPIRSDEPERDFFLEGNAQVVDRRDSTAGARKRSDADKGASSEKPR